MIAKKIRNPKKSASKYVRIQRLVDYVRNPRSKEEKEKCVYEGTRNFFEENKKAQVKEMQDLAHAAVRSKDPVNHYVISWKSHEKPTKEQIERTVDMVLDELKMKEHKVIYAVHADTKHHHLHLVVNRVHPETEKVNKAWNDYDAMDRAVARITHEQNWERKQNERFQVNERDEVERIVRSPRALQPTQEKRDQEHRTGWKSAERIAQEKASTVIRGASSWRSLHEELAREGLRYEPKGRNGAVVVVGDVAVKASRVGRECSLGNLQKRLGAFEASLPQTLKKVHPEPIQPQSTDWHRYQQEKARHEDNKKSAVASIREKHAQEKQQLSTQNKEKQAQLLSQDWKGRGKELNQERSQMAAENKAALASLKAAQASELQSIKQKYPAFPSLEVWRAKQRQQQPEHNQQPIREPHKQAAQEETKQRQEPECVAQQPVRRKQPDIER